MADVVSADCQGALNALNGLWTATVSLSELLTQIVIEELIFEAPELGDLIPGILDLVDNAVKCAEAVAETAA